MRLHASMKFLLLAVCVLVCACAGVARAERTYYDITASDVRKIMIAVPDFTLQTPVQGGNGSAIAQLLSRGLDLHGFVKVIDNAQYGGGRNADWKTLGADYVILGQVVPDSAGIMVEGRLLDVTGNRELAVRRFRGEQGQLEDMILRLCDGLIEDFSGEKGVSRTKLAYVSDATGRKEVYVSDILGLHPRQITRHQALCVSPRFTPDNNFLAYSTYHHGNQDLYITDLRQNTTTRSLSRQKGLNLAPAFTPDGQRMVVTLSMNGNPDLYLMDRQGKVIEQLTSRSGINVSPSLSPNGRTLAFVSDRSGKPNVYTMDMGSRKTKRLSYKCSESSEPAWSPKGDDIAYTCLQNGTYQLHIMDADGGTTRQLSSGGGNFETPSWSPDGRLLAVTRKSGQQSEIWVISKNGKDVRKLFNLKGNQSSPQWSGRLP